MMEPLNPLNVNVWRSVCRSARTVRPPQDLFRYAYFLFPDSWLSQQGYVTLHDRFRWIVIQSIEIASNDGTSCKIRRAEIPCLEPSCSEGGDVQEKGIIQGPCSIEDCSR